MAGSSNGREGKKAMFPKPEDLDYELPPYPSFSGNVGDNVASSSGGKLRAFFIGMGFLPSLVDKVIEENGEENSDMLLEVLLRSSAQKSNSDSSDCLEGSLYTRRGKQSAPNFCPVGHSKEALQKSNSQSSDSLDSLFDDDDPQEISTVNQLKEEPDELNEVIDDKKGSLLMMNFSVKEVDFAIQKIGSEASVPELVDFIFAAQIAEKFKKETEDVTRDDIFAARIAQKFKKEALDVIFIDGETSNEELFGIMETTLQLLEMGFSENEVSSAFDRLGPDVPISEYANFIFAAQNGIEYVMEYKYPSTSSYYYTGIKEEPQTDLYGTPEVKTENFSHEPSQSRHVNIGETQNGNRMKEEEIIDEFPHAFSNLINSDFLENDRGKRPKYEYDDDSSFFLDPYWVEEKVDTELYKSNPSRRRLSNVASKPPFFLYGNISSISNDSWAKLSQFLYAVEPEFVNTQFFSALNRKEGYLHNLPTENRFHILPSSPMTIEEAIPRTKKWWPPWDSRKQLSCNINCETGGITQLCDRLGNILADSGGVPSSEQQKEIIRYCRGLNLLWTGKYKLGPMEPENLELILGYPLNHTVAESNLRERFKLLKYCFQTDTLGYHLSVLKNLFPNGLTVLSLFSGIGGAEIALHRLEIKLKAVVSVETSVTKRKILERWWRSSGQTGNLVQIEDIQKLTTKTLENLVSKFGVFDLVIAQHPASSSNSDVRVGQSISALDFSLFCESVRVLQRVRVFCKV